MLEKHFFSWSVTAAKICLVFVPFKVFQASLIFASKNQP
jgi:hypothetical protein